jgi:hypothetical protein
VQQFPVQDFPICAWRLELPPAGILSGSEQTNEVEAELKVWITNPNNKFVPQYPTKAFSINYTAFSQMLAKIGYSYAAARVGTDALLQMVPDIILGNSDKSPYLVGGGLIFPVGGGPALLGHKILSSSLHRLAMHDITVGSQIFTAVSIHLFGQFGFPVYHVVVRQRSANE